MASRASVHVHQTNSGKSPKFVLSPALIFCSPISHYVCGVVFFLWKYISCEKWAFSFDRSNMQIFTLNITRVVWPHVPSSLDLRYFCRHNPLSYDLKLVPGHYWSWQRTISFLVNIFVRNTFYMSKSCIKTETALTMTDTTEPTELLAFKRQKDGYKVTVKISICISAVLSYQPFPNFFGFSVRLLKWPVTIKNFALAL